LVIMFVPIVVVLGAAYFWFLSGDYAVLLRGARPQEAATIVEELKKTEVSFRLADGGTTILVPAADLDALRLELSAKALPMKGTVGFELFNESDMGLTDFAQKVNYQRALQGEIARTIMAMEGIAEARVHLSLPERSLFRTSRSEPRAAVTLTPAPGIAIDPGRIAGIQRLVAAAVPDLAFDEVAVLNERGQLITPAYSDSMVGTSSALERTYADRAAQAIAAVAPGLQLDIKATTISRPPSGTDAIGSQVSSSSGEPERDHSIRLVLFSRAPISLELQEAIRSAVTTELRLSGGDRLLFSPTPQVAQPQVELAAPVERASEALPVTGLVDRITQYWAAAMILIAIALIGAWQVRRRRYRLVRRQDLAVRIREQLRLAGSET